MAVNDTAMKLANEIKNSKEYKQFRKYMKEVKNDKECEKLLKDYRDIQLQMQSYAMRNQQIDKKTMNKIEGIQKKVTSNKRLCDYLNSEQRFTLMMDNINKILAQAVQKDYK
ncbi:YlbF family regulator [Romboutsia sp.]|uniref:YlbF family regulator n=1 Tax=Romboutsia sp. TaxID=1965302 RepID=UPI002BD93CB8|nr:YlbF family regulator [Romboutsia sp.]HSQ88273.1 YlbF family regulator [Romboutsia sp.]